MPRNATGSYSLPSSAFAPNTLIQSALVNANFSDIATAITQSMATTGVSTMTGPFKAAAGSVSAPGIGFGSSPTTGFWLNGANQIGWAAAGVQGALFNSNLSVTWAGAATWVGAGSFGGALTVSAGGAAITGNSAITGTLGVSSALTVSSGGAAISGNSVVTGTLTSTGLNTASGYKVGSNPTATPGKGPTVQVLLSGASQTYTTPAGVAWVRIRMCGAGGGGASLNGSTGGAAGGLTNFGPVDAAGGGGSSTTGGTGGGSGAGSATWRQNGNSGGSGDNANSANVLGTGGTGGAGAFGGAGAGGYNGAGGGVAVTGSGAGGGGAGGGVNQSGGGGGGAGEYLELIIQSPAATYGYTIGAGGAGGGGGGAGGSGRVIVEEYYS